ncbi:MAG: damage-inducible protein DinB [Alphaproteobacteria bacterium]|nr:MAG: damage-inducible protein DinB [Alphaproteobacteria bacterium]
MKSKGSPISKLLEDLYRYKLWANSELLAQMLTVDASKHENDLHTAIRILNHTYVVDRIFSGHLTGTPSLYKATNTEETPTLDNLTKSIRNSDSMYLDYVAGLTSSALAESIDFKFTDGDSGSMTRSEILAHLINHGSYHRGAAGRILAQLSIAPPKDTFTAFIHRLEPRRRMRN